MKLSEKIQEALRQQQEINLSDPAVQKRLAAQWGYVPADAQPAPSFADAYQGAMEEVAIWKRRALEAEDLNRKFVAEINGPAYMGEPAQPAPSVPEDVMRDAERYRYLRARDEETDGVGCWLEAKGRVCDRGWLYGDQLDSAIDTCIEMIAAAPEAKP